MKIVQKYMTNSACYKANQKITPQGLVLHSVGINQPNADVFVKNYSTAKDKSMHGFIDARNGTIIETLPQNINGWHIGGSANKTHLGFEMCEPAEIKYTTGANFTVTNLAAAQKACKIAYDAAVEYFAYLCKKYRFDPLRYGVIISHSEAYKRGVGSNHADPEHLWKGLNMPYTMDGFRKDVNEALNGKTENNTDAIYKVQIGAFKEKANADAYAELATKAGFTAIVVKEVKGDLDGDGKVTAADARIGLRKAVGLDD